MEKEYITVIITKVLHASEKTDGIWSYIFMVEEFDERVVIWKTHYERLQDMIGQDAGVKIRAELRGKFEMDQKYGRQFRAYDYHLAIFSELTNEEYARLLCPKVVARAKFDQKIYRSDLLNVVFDEQQAFEIFIKTKVISPTQLEKMQQILRKYLCLNLGSKCMKAMQFIKKYELSQKVAEKIFEMDIDMEKFDNGPYRYLRDIIDDEFREKKLTSVSIQLLDQIAITKMKISPTNQDRIGIITNILIELCNNESGSTLMKQSAFDESLANTQFFQNGVEKQAAAQYAKTNLTIDNNGVRLIQCTKYLTFERFISRFLTKFSSLPSYMSEQLVQQILQSVEQQEGLYDQQKKAIESIVKNPITIITGGPGCGKTYVLKYCNALLQSHFQIFFCAFTGIASLNLKDAIGEQIVPVVGDGQCSTIHRLVKRRIGGDKEKPMILVVDEVSMISTSLLFKLLKWVKKANAFVKIVFVGDSDQLPPISPGNTLQDLMKEYPQYTTTISQNKRQLAESSINQFAKSIKDNQVGQYIQQLLESQIKVSDIRFEFCSDENKFEYVKQIYQQMVAQGKDPQILCNTKDFVEKANLKIVGERASTKDFQVGDKVIELKNKHEQTNESQKIIMSQYLLGIQNNFPQSENTIQQVRVVVNGLIGRVSQKDPLVVTYKRRRADKVKIVGTQQPNQNNEYDHTVPYETQQKSTLEHAYAITVHKSQGSEFDDVILMISDKFRDKSLLYTGVTRAKKNLIVIATKPSSIYQSNIMFEERKERITMLFDKRYTIDIGSPIQKEQEEYGYLYVIVDDKRGFFKVGSTKNIENRRRSYKTHNPAFVDFNNIFATINYKSKEKHIHEILKKQFQLVFNGSLEWYKIQSSIEECMQNVMNVMKQVIG